jgi:putative lipoic acid-binding regulatory protein
VSDEDEQRARAIALLEANHEFPTDYSLSVIAFSGDEVTARIVEAVFEGHAAAPPGTHEKRPSSGGKYLSHRLTIRCEDAHHVLRIYARLRTIEGVVTIL